MNDKQIQITEPFYSDAYKGYRVEAQGADGWTDSIIVYNPTQAAAVLQIANSRGWYAAKRYEREINLARATEAEAERERQRQQQQSGPR